MKIKIVDDLSPEDVAMLQALYSRSAESVDVHLEKVAKTGSGKFMESYYVGYNHKSIADCGSTTVFVEGVSLLAAKAIQDWPLYSGQETSTRYIDMSKQHIVDPINSAESQAILDRWMTFYMSKQEAVAEIVRQRHPRRPDEDEKRYASAVKARTFDILRGFLPAGITTQLSWHTNLRQAGDHLTSLLTHPLQEMNTIGALIGQALGMTYPSTFNGHQSALSGVRSTSEQIAWEQEIGKDTYSATWLWSDQDDEEVILTLDNFNLDYPFPDYVRTRPRGCVLPHKLTECGQVQLDFLLDFGSWRDIQRQRNGVCLMPMLTGQHGFEPWYLDQFDAKLHAEAQWLIDFQHDEIQKLEVPPEIKQYYYALGFRVPTQLTYGLPALLYVLELRSSKTVHPSLRKKILKAVDEFRLEDAFRDVALHADMDPDDWTVRRGEQTITEKK